MIVTYYTYGKTGLSVRTGPGLKFTKLARLPYGTAVSAAMAETRPGPNTSYSSPSTDAEGNQWVYITEPKKGWVAQRYKGINYLLGTKPKPRTPTWAPTDTPTDTTTDTTPPSVSKKASLAVPLGIAAALILLLT